MLAQTFLWLFVVALGTAFGAGLYEARIVLPLWFEPRVDAAAMRRIDTGRQFWGFVSTGPLTLLTLFNIGFALGSDSTHWRAAAFVTLVERLFTFSYFIPTAIALSKSDTTLTAEETESKAHRWRALNWVRLILSLAGWLLAMKAVGG